MKKMAALIALAAAVSLAPRPAAAQTVVTCESTNGHKEICPVNTSGGVTVYRQLSSTTCVQGRNWNLTPSVIWVNGGCRAQFMVGNTRGGRYDNGGYNNGGYNNNLMQAEGRVGWIDYQRGQFQLVTSGRTYTVMMPYNSSAADANQFRNLRQNSYVRVQGQLVGNNQLQLTRFY